VVVWPVTEAPPERFPMVNSLVNVRGYIGCVRVVPSGSLMRRRRARSPRDRLWASFASRRSPVRSRYAPSPV